MILVGSSTFKAVVVGCMFAAASAVAAEYNLKPSATDWQSPDSYVETTGTGNLPPAGSDLIIPENGAMTVSTASDFAFLNTMMSVKPLKGSTLTVYVADGSTNTLSCAVYVSHNVSAWVVGTLVKTGGGTLNLTSPGNIVGPYNELSDYHINLDVQKGTLMPFKDVNVRTNFKLIRGVSVAEGAVLVVPPRGTFSVWNLDGYGSVTNCESGACSISMSSAGGERSHFYGSIGGNISLSLSGAIYFHGTNNSFSGTISSSGYTGNPSYYKGFLGVMSFGTKTEPKSLGASGYFTLGSNSDGKNAYVEYLGEGETVSWTFGINSTDASPCTMDAGANGGLLFTGPWRNWSNTGDLAIVLCGSNTVNVSTLRSSVFEVKANTRDNITKRGTGKWALQKYGSSSNIGSIGVEDGTLSFDSIDNRYHYSALGTAEALRGASFSGANASAPEVPYAFELGGTNGVPVFEYTGETAGYACDRPIALKGGVAHLRSSGAGPLKMRGAWMPAAGSATFVLDGANTGDNVFSSISNGLGTVSVVKDGAGTWTLSGAQDFSGSLEVREGTLKLSNKSRYEWYRVLFKETYANAVGASTKTKIQCKGVGLYDAQGNRIGTNLLHVADFRTMGAGESAYGTPYPVTQNATCPWQTTTEWLSSAKDWYTYGEGSSDYAGWNITSPFSKDIVKSDPSSWVPVVMRLTNGSPEVVGCDIAQRYWTGQADAASRNKIVSAFELQGSSDGLDWRTLVDVEGCTNMTADIQWAKTGTSNWGKQMRKLSNVETESYYFGDATSRTASTFLSRVSEVKVARGAALEVSEGEVSLPEGVTLSVDCAGEGVASISGVSIPVHGTLNVTGTVNKLLELPVTFDCGDSYENMATWDVNLNGKAFKGWVSCRGGKVTLHRSGMILLVM